jgi:hypothetical protein
VQYQLSIRLAAILNVAAGPAEAAAATFSQLSQ